MDQDVIASEERFLPTPVLDPAAEERYQTARKRALDNDMYVPSRHAFFTEPQPAVEVEPEPEKESLKKRLIAIFFRDSPFAPKTLLDQLITSPLLTVITWIYKVTLKLRGPPFKVPPESHRIRVVCISDTHSNTPTDLIPDGDLLIHAGDLTSTGRFSDIQAALNWLDTLPHPQKVVIAGNHDSFFDERSKHPEDAGPLKDLNFRNENITFLQNEVTTLVFERARRRINIYGAADIPACGGDDMAFQYLPTAAPWSSRSIFLSTDILVTHTPPFAHLDNAGMGCPTLLEQLWVIKPRLHVFGHVHSGAGRENAYYDEAQAAYERLCHRYLKTFSTEDELNPMYGKDVGGGIGSGSGSGSGSVEEGVSDDDMGGALFQNSWATRNLVRSEMELERTSKWGDAGKVIWYGIKGVFKDRFGGGWKEGSEKQGSVLVNAAMVHQTTTEIRKPKVHVVDI